MTLQLQHNRCHALEYAYHQNRDHAPQSQELLSAAALLCRMRSNSSSALFLFSSSSVRTLLTHATDFSELTPVQTDADVVAHTCATARVHHVNRPGLAPLRLRSRSQAVARPSPPGMNIELSSVDLSNQLNCDAVCDSKCNLIFLSTHASRDRETRQATALREISRDAPNPSLSPLLQPSPEQTVLTPSPNFSGSK